MYQYLKLNVEDKIATITLSRPEVGNAFATKSYIEVREAMDACNEDENINVVVITGEGKNFCGGGDIKSFKQDYIDTKVYFPVPLIEKPAQMAASVLRCCKPVIAMINGAAAGAGASLALACDFRIMTPKSQLVMAFIKIGLSGDTGGMYLLKHLVGTSKALELMMLGTPIGGEEALRMGLANRLAENTEQLADITYKFARQLSDSPMAAIKMQKQLMVETFYRDFAVYVIPEAENMSKCSRSADFEEAVNAFLEKRRPNFSGK